MRIVAVVTGPEALADAAGLAGEIRTFNAGVDFRLRFLHVEIEALFGAGAREGPELSRRVEWARPFAVRDGDPLRAAAGLALALHRERPELVVLVGDGELLGPGVAAAGEAGVKLAFFGGRRGSAEGALDLGAEPAAALDRITGVAREIR
jgi:hypothetical protein